MSHSSNYLQSSLKFSENPIQTLDTDNETPTISMPSENNAKFFEEFINAFYNRIISTDSFDNFEVLSIKWIKNTLGYNDMNVEIFLELI